MLTTAIFFEHAIFNLERFALRYSEPTGHTRGIRRRGLRREGEGGGRHAMALVNTKAAGVVAYPRLFSPPFAHLSSARAVLAPSSLRDDLRYLGAVSPLFFQ